jgi:hypothetical protein
VIKPRNYFLFIVAVFIGVILFRCAAPPGQFPPLRKDGDFVSDVIESDTICPNIVTTFIDEWSRSAGLNATGSTSDKYISRYLMSERRDYYYEIFINYWPGKIEIRTGTIHPRNSSGGLFKENDRESEYKLIDLRNKIYTIVRECRI